MEAIKIMIPIAIALGVFFVGLFIWITKSGQYDDLDTPSKRMLLDDEDEYHEYKSEDKDKDKYKEDNNTINHLTHERKDV